MDQRASSSNTALYVLLGVFGAVALTFLGILGCCGLGIFGAFTAARMQPTNLNVDVNAEIKAELAAERFLDAISRGKVDEAYDSASAGFQQRTSREQFHAFVTKHPRLTDSVDRNAETQSNQNGTLRLQATIDDSMEQQFSATIDMVEEEKQWKVDRITIP